MKTFWKISLFFFVCGFLEFCASATAVKRRPRFPINSVSNGENELCPKVRIGQDDLPGFDLISQFQVDKAASRRAIQRIVGSTALQVAYKLGNNVDFRIPTRHLYPGGLPEEYSFLTTFRMTGSTLEKHWSIWQIQDSSGKEQVGVKINGQTKSVAFSYKGLDGSLQSAAFSNLPSLFDSQWHKVMIGVERSSATLFVDCKRIESLPIKPRGQINVDGFAVLGKLVDNPQVSVPCRNAAGNLGAAVPFCCWFTKEFVSRYSSKYLKQTRTIFSFVLTSDSPTRKHKRLSVLRGMKNSISDDIVVVMVVTKTKIDQGYRPKNFHLYPRTDSDNDKVKLVTKMHSSTYTLYKKK